MTGNTEEHLKELAMIRKLLILALIRSGMSQKQIGAALGVHQTTIGRMFPAGAFGEPPKSVGKPKPKQADAEAEQ